MKNVLIVSHGMEIGGAESALLGLLNSFDYNNYHVDLFLLHHIGDLMEYIPNQVNLLPENPKYASLAVGFSQVLKNRAFSVGLCRYIGGRKAEKYILSHSLSDGSYVCIDYSHRYTVGCMPMISDKKYDIAISFLTPHYFVSQKVNASKKVAWIHTDYSSIEIDVESELKMWSAYDVIAAISEEVKHSFLKIFPSLKDKIIIIENIHPAKSITSRADEFEVSDEMPDDGDIKLLSVGRYCYAKNFDNVPDITRRIIESGVNVKWYIISFGGDEDELKEKISKAGMDGKVILLGKKVNPYPYFKRCDFYVQPSRYEGNSVTVNEALILKKSVIITNYATSSSQINNGVDGVIVPLDNCGCADGIAQYIKNEELRQKILNNVSCSDYSKSDEINKLYSII